MISISILDADLFNLKNVLNELKNNKITHIHIDVLDTSFVPNISFGPTFINKILEWDFKFDIHLMIKDPRLILDSINLEKVETVTIHYEIPNFHEIITFLNYKNVKICVALNPDTINVKLPFELIYRILIMTVYPGFGSQKFIEKALDKISLLQKYNIKIGIDGGINLDTIKKVKQFDYFVTF
ncbi:ribulose-phosphate 3-epimerase [Vairimorpha apis BRL 01]|uniref:Ribulose-phosphate 3-epimerase n=1 Tax=Vairimorpha apis BRL 01 TaxID=1037528 RepID=T0L2D8_9MICR|nr:ribulose-phosphate 3-epimerase [Vairimorpha apis BRL 01]